MQRHWTANVSNPFDLVDWVTTHIKLTNWKTQEVVYENDVEHPADWAPSAVEICASKYFRKADIPKIGGEHSVKQLATRVANDLAQHGRKRGYFNEEEAAIFRDEIIAGFITQRIGFNSPVWFNFGLYNEYGIEGTKGRDRFFVNPETNEIEQLDRELIRPGGAACFLTKVTDSLFSDAGDGMFDWIATQTKVFLTGAGDGANVSDIRGVSEPISGGGVSAGLPAFLPVRDQGSGYIKSGGKTRRSATMLVCDLDHPDIEWYINWKRHEEAKAQALIAMGYDSDFEGEAYGTVSGQNSNNSVRVPNSFMEALQTDGDWYLLSRCQYDRFPDAVQGDPEKTEDCPQGQVFYYNGKPDALRIPKGEVRKIMKVVKATDLWAQITESAWSCGCPGIHFEDTINTWNTMPHYGEIRTSNPCSEVFQPDNTTCNLCSVNLIKFFANLSDPDWAGFKHASRLVTIALDLVVDISSYPTKQHARGAWDIRSIGANHGNIGAVLMRNALPYDSHEGRAVMSMITNIMTLFCWQQSNELGEKLGSYPAYDQANHSRILDLHRSAILEDDMVERFQNLLGGYDFEDVVESWRILVLKGAFRNSNVTCLVPQGTIGLVLGQDTTGCEPDFALKKSKKCVGGTYMNFVNNSVEAALEKLGYDEERRRLIKAYVMKYGAVENCPYIDEAHLPIFDTAVRQKTCLDAIAYIVRNLEEEEAELVFNATGNENDPYKLKMALEAAREDEEEWEELLEDLDTVAEVNEIIKNCTSMDQVRKALAEYEYDLFSILPCVQIFTRVISHNGHIDALGAFQPHISMGISKTVNMNHDVSIGDVAKAYERAFDKGCKCIAIYRDDSKQSQPLNTGTNKGKKGGKKVAEKPVEAVSFEESIDTYLRTPEGLRDALNRVVNNPELAALVPPTRREPSTHTSVGDRFRFTLPHQGASIGVFIRFNCWEGTNDLMEVFIDLGKEGDTISGLIDSMARMISLGLQFGIPPQTIGDMLEGMNFGPNGFLGKSSVFGIRSVKSVPDLVGKLLKILPEYYALGRPEAMLHPKPYSPEDPPPNYEAVRQAGIIAKSNGHVNGSSPNPKTAKIDNLEASLRRVDRSSSSLARTGLAGGVIPSSVARSLMPVEALPQGATALEVKPETDVEITTPQEARLRGFTGSTCKKCGSLRTVGTGSCFQCLDCGEYNGPCGG